MDNKKRLDYIVIGAFLILFYLLLKNIGVIWSFIKILLGILTPFLMGGAFAFVLNLPMRFFENKVFGRIKKFPQKLRRPLAMILTLLLVILVIYAVISLLIPELEKTLESVFQALPKALERLNLFLTERGFDLGAFLQENFLGSGPEELRGRIEQVLNLALKGAIFSTGVIGSVYSTLLQFCFTLMFTVYFLLAKERLAKQFCKLGYAFISEKRMDRLREIGDLTEKIFSSFITGQCLEAMILGVLFFVVMSLFRMPYVLLISVVIAIFALIPVVGAWIGCIVGFLLILMVSPMKALGFILMFVILQQLEGNLIYPHVMGNAIGLPSIWVLFAVVLGDGLMGVLGMLLFIPLTSVVYTLMRQKVQVRLEERGLQGKVT